MSESKSGKSRKNSNGNNGINRTTDWNAYYHQKKSWFSTHTQQFTLALINEALDKYCGLNVERHAVGLPNDRLNSRCLVA